MSNPERLAYWYLRLNGFLLLENFVVHPDIGHDQRTDADLLGIRFQHREENLLEPMKDDQRIVNCQTFCNVVIAEVKTRHCALNGPWTQSEEENIQRVLAAIGCVQKSERHKTATALYENGEYTSEMVTIRLIAFGDEEAELIPKVPQILFDDMLKFIFGRFQTYSLQKSSVGNWTEDGRMLRNLATTPDFDNFRNRARQYFRLRQRGVYDR